MFRKVPSFCSNRCVREQTETGNDLFDTLHKLYISTETRTKDKELICKCWEAMQEKGLVGRYSTSEVNTIISDRKLINKEVRD